MPVSNGRRGPKGPPLGTKGGVISSEIRKRVFNSQKHLSGPGGGGEKRGGGGGESNIHSPGRGKGRKNLALQKKSLYNLIGSKSRARGKKKN